MAEANCPKGPSKELVRFTRELLDYIWQNYRFSSQTLDKAFKDKLKFDEQYPVESQIRRHFNEDIGKAVLCTQYLLRELCHFFFDWFGSDMISTDSFFKLCIYHVCIKWVEERSTDVFLKVFDAAAIVAEAILYCDAVLKVEVDLSAAPFILSSILHRRKLKSQFFINGGWKQLTERAFNDFVYLNMNLERFVSFRRFKYQRLDYSCPLIKMLLNSPVLFPVEYCKICPDCEVPSKFITTEFKCAKSLIWESREAYEEECLQYGLQEEPLDLSVSAFKGKFEKIMYGSFICKIIGSLEDKDLPEYKAESSSKKKKKKKKRKYKTESDTTQTAKATTGSTQTADLEAENSQYSEESCEE